MGIIPSDKKCGFRFTVREMEYQGWKYSRLMSEPVLTSGP